jgi:hypothetical protein
MELLKTSSVGSLVLAPFDQVYGQEYNAMESVAFDTLIKMCPLKLGPVQFKR